MAKDAKSRRTANLATPNDLGANASKDVAGGLNILLADVIALYFKTKNFHWHVSGPHFRAYHEMFDEQAAQILGTTDAIAERVRKAVAEMPGPPLTVSVGVAMLAADARAALIAADLALYDAKTKKPSRVSVIRRDDGRRIRVTKRSGTELD